MREIKFRAYSVDGEDTRMDFFDLTEDGLNVPWIAKNCEIMQYTGLKDKNGKEIYEGDLLSHNDKVYEVKWDGFMAAFQSENIEDKVDADFFNWGNVPSLTTSGIPGHFRSDMLDANCEVIGNIYENPELLK